MTDIPIHLHVAKHKIIHRNIQFKLVAIRITAQLLTMQ